MRRSFFVRAGVVATLALAGVAWAGCSRGNVTELVAGVSTQVQVPKELQTVRLTVKANGVDLFCGIYKVYDGRVRLPRTLGVNKQHDNVPITIAVTGYTQPYDPSDATFYGDCLNVQTDERILRRSIQQYRDGHVLYVPMPLRWSCFDQKDEQICSADEGKTCKAGKCVDATVDPNSLIEYRPELLDGSNPASCFSQLLCLSGEQVAKLVDANNCIYELPNADSSGNLNVRLIYDGFVSEVLDQDPDEGFTIVDPQHFKLAAPYCDPAAAKKVLAVSASHQCVPKVITQPVCDDGTQVLIPAPSAVTVVVDRAPETQKMYGSNAQKLDTPLTDPVFSTTSVGFLNVHPGDVNVCGDTYSNFDSAFGDVPLQLAFLAQGQIVSALKGDPGETSGVPSAPFGVVIHGAAQSLAQLAQQSASQGQPLNEAAIAIVTGRNPVDTSVCSGANDPLAAAAAALQQGVKTYVFVIKPPDGLPDPDQTTFDNANALAAAGGTGQAVGFTSLDKNPDQASLDGFGQIISSLSSCLYEKPGNITDPAKAKVQIISAAAGGFKDVGYNAQCSSSNTSVDGWSMDDKQIRICGASCDTIRQAQTTVNESRSIPGFEIPNVIVTAAQKFED